MRLDKQKIPADDLLLEALLEAPRSLFSPFECGIIEGTRRQMLNRAPGPFLQATLREFWMRIEREYARKGARDERHVGKGNGRG